MNVHLLCLKINLGHPIALLLNANTNDNKKRIRLCRKSNAQTLVALSLSIRNLSWSLRNSILKVPCESLSLYVVSESGPSTNWVVVVDRKMMGPFEALVFIFEGIENDIEWLVTRASSELTPRPMRTMISEN